MSQIRSIIEDEIESLGNLNVNVNIHTTKEFNYDKYRFLDLVKQVLVVNLINIPFMLKEMGVSMGLFVICVYLLLSTFSLILLDEISNCSKSNDIKKSIENKFLYNSYMVLNFFIDIIRLYFSTNHIVTYIGNFGFVGKFINLLCFSLFISILSFIKGIYKNRIGIIIYLSTILAVIITTYPFYTRFYDEDNQIIAKFDTDGFFKQLGLLALWTTPRHDVLHTLNVKDIKTQIFLSYLIKICFYTTIAIFGYYGYRNTEPIYVNNFKMWYNPIIIIFYILQSMRIPGLVRNITEPILKNVNQTDAIEIIHILLGFCLMLPVTVICSFKLIDLIALILCTFNTLIVPCLIITSYKNLKKIFRFLVIINMSVGINILVMLFLFY